MGRECKRIRLLDDTRNWWQKSGLMRRTRTGKVRDYDVVVMVDEEWKINGGNGRGVEEGEEISEQNIEVRRVAFRRITKEAHIDRLCEVIKEEGRKRCTILVLNEAWTKVVEYTLCGSNIKVVLI